MLTCGGALLMKHPFNYDPIWACYVLFCFWMVFIVMFLHGFMQHCIDVSFCMLPWGPKQGGMAGREEWHMQKSCKTKLIRTKRKISIQMQRKAPGCRYLACSLWYLVGHYFHPCSGSHSDGRSRWCCASSTGWATSDALQVSLYCLSLPMCLWGIAEHGKKAIMQENMYVHSSKD